MYLRFIKRWIDFLLAFIILVIVSPLFLGLIVLLAYFNRGNVFFYQNRPGKNEQLFGLLKFKTMLDLVDQEGNLLPDKDRITPVGKFIRQSSLDELPQLINVLKGDMSLVGPRPLLVKYLPLYNENQRRRHQVKPGITGWAQVNGRNTISWHQKFSLDLYYIDNVSFGLDLKILLLTFAKVFKGKDVNASQNTTMQPFNGNN